MANGYWSKLLAVRRRRRRLLTAGATFGVSTVGALLLGCSGGGGDEQAEQRGLLTSVRDRTSEAVRGGRSVSNYNDIPGLDPITSTNTGTRIIGGATFNRLFQFKPGVLKPAGGEIVGDLAESYEQSPDGLRLTVKLRRNAGTDPRPPLNGRTLSAQDVQFSWNSWAERSSLRATLVNRLDANAPVVSVTAPDEQTVVFNLAFPSILVLGYLTDGFYFWVIPREAGGGYDPRIEAHGAGPWYLESYEPNSQYRMKRNPNYYDARLPYLDEITIAALTEPAATLAQFEAKKIDMSSTMFGSAGVNNENVVDVFKRHQEMTLFGVPTGSPGSHIRVGYKEGSPFRDVRIRRAVSMLMDREELAEYFTNAGKLAQQGIPTDAVWVSHMSTAYPAAMDPRDSDFGPNSANFQHNPAEALKLLEAAGSAKLAFPMLAHNFSRESQVDTEVLAQQLQRGGLQPNVRVADFNAEFLPTVNRGRGDFSALAVLSVHSGFSPESCIYASYHPTPETTTVRRGDFLELTAMTDAILKEFDEKKRATLIKDWLRRAGAEMPSIPVGAVAPAYHLAWPWMGNVGVFQRWLGPTATNVEVYKHYFYDATKAA